MFGITTLLSLPAFVLAAGLLALAPASAQNVPIRLGHVLPESHSWHVSAKNLAEAVARDTQGRVSIQLFPASQLGDERTMVEGLQLGTVTAAIIGSGSFQAVEPKMGIVELPYAWSSRESAFKALDGDLGAALAKLLDAKNIVVLAWGENGYRHITNSKRPITKPEDLKGLKIRVTPDKVRLDTFRALGAEPAPLAFGELYSALQQGVFDAQENPLSIIYASSFYEVQKNLSLTGHIWGAATLVMSKPTWNRISTADRTVIMQAASRWKDQQRGMITASDAEFRQKLAEKGMAVNEVQTAPFAEAVQPIWKAQEAVIGSDLFAILNRYRQGS
jgi:tripartite ATP-independent transporter DctP family solute receptor